MILPHRNRMLLPVLWFIAITWLSTKGGISLPGFNLIGTDKLAHAAAYALLVWLILSAFPKVDGKSLMATAIFAFLYGAFMEWVQFTFFPNRFFELDDMLANGIGAVASAVVYYYLYKKNNF